MKRTTFGKLALLSAAVALLLMAVPVSSQDDITITNLGSLGSYGRTADVNNHGQVVGWHEPPGVVGAVHFLWTPENGWLDLPGSGLSYVYVNDLGHVAANEYVGAGSVMPTLWENGQVTPLGHLGGEFAVPRAFNEVGQVAGDSTTVQGECHAFLWTPGAAMQDLGTLGGTQSKAVAMNNSGWVVGDSRTAGANNHAFLWTPSGGMRDLGTLGGSYSRAYDINGLGQVIGGSSTAAGTDHAFLWTAKGGMTDLGTLGGSYSAAYDINEAGQVVGWSSIPGDAERHAFLWTPDGGMRDLGTLGSTRSRATRVNNNGQVVGTGWLATGESRAFVWTPFTGMLDLGTLPGGQRSDAVDINEHGQVVGWSDTSTGERGAVLWTILLTPAEQARSMIGTISALADDGVLKAGTANGLTQKLDNAASNLDEGKTRPACGQLRAFVNQVEAAMKPGSIPADLGADLIDSASAIMAQVCE